MHTSRFRTGLRLIALTLACAPTAFVAETLAQPSDRWPVQQLTDQAAIAAAATQFVTMDDDDPVRPATAISATTAITIPAVATSSAAGPYPASVVVSGFQGAILNLAVRLNNLSHPWPDDLEVLLVGPGGQKVILMSDAGGGGALEHAYLTFNDRGGDLPDDAQIVTGEYRPTDFENPASESLPAPAPPAPYSQTLRDFNGTSPNGTWSLFVSDDRNGDTGSLYGFTLIITPIFDNSTPSPVPPTGSSSATESPLTVGGIFGPITRVTVLFHITHSFDQDLDISLVGPDGTTVELTSDNGGDGDNYGIGCPYNARTAFFDNPGATPIGMGTAPFVGLFRPEQPLSAFIGKSGAAANGTWKLRIVDDDQTNPFSGVLQCWSILVEEDENAIVEPPSALTVTSVAGDLVTLRWVAPGAGPEPTNYVLEGGVNPGQTVASFSTGSANPILTFAAPTGSFYLRLRSQAGESMSTVSNEVALFVNFPRAPSPPAQLLGVVSGSSVGLSWRNTFEGGAPTSLVADVTGVGSIPLGLTESVSFTGVPSGSYTLQLRAVNAAGSSVASNSTTLVVPSPCLSTLRPPSNFLAYKIAQTLHLLWEPSLGGDQAATGFIVNVTGAFIGSFPVSGRSVSGTVGPGTYHFSIAATNACGVSVPTAVQSVVIP